MAQATNDLPPPSRQNKTGFEKRRLGVTREESRRPSHRSLGSLSGGTDRATEIYNKDYKEDDDALGEKPLYDAIPTTPIVLLTVGSLLIIGGAAYLGPVVIVFGAAFLVAAGICG
jgi:hypothetical protein